MRSRVYLDRRGRRSTRAIIAQINGTLEILGMADFTTIESDYILTYDEAADIEANRQVALVIANRVWMIACDRCLPTVTIHSKITYIFYGLFANDYDQTPI